MLGRRLSTKLDKVGPGFRRVAGNTGWLMLDRVVRMGTGLFVGVWVARYLGPGRFGLLNYTIAFASLFGAFATLGLDGIVIRDLVKFPERNEVILGSAFVLKLAGAAVAFLVAIAGISLLRPGDTLALSLVAISASGLIFQSLNVIDLYFQAKVQSKYSVYAANGAFILMTMVKVGLLLYAAPLVAFAWVALGEISLTACFLLIAYRLNHLNLRNWRYRLDVMRDLLRYSWPLMLSGISIMISMRVDQVLIGQMLNDRDVGLYSAAARISEVWYFIPLAIASSAFPALVEAKAESEALYYQRLQKLYNFLVILAVVIALTMTFLSRTIITTLYGHAYTAAAGALAVLIWSGVPVSFGCAWSNWMLLENRTRTMFLVQLISAAVNVVLNIAMIPHFGITGSAVATLITYWSGFIVLFATVRSQHRALTMFAKALFPFWRLFARNGS